MITPHLPILVVIAPLLCAPFVVFIRSAAASWYVTFLVSALSLVFAIMLLMQTLELGTLSYALGGWAPPLGIEYRIDAANGFVLLIITAISTLILPYARTSIADEIDSRSINLFYTCYLLCLGGLLGVVATGDAFNAFVFLEISSLSTYALIAAGAGRDRRALTASFTYLVMGTIGATFFVLGVGMLYMVTGTLNMADMATRIPAIDENRTVVVAFAFIVTGIGLKVAIFPLHLWLPNAYAFAPSAVSVFLAATATKAAIYLLIRFVFSVFGADYAMLGLTLGLMLLPLALIAMFAASTVAIFQVDIKRMLAYSSIAQVGYMILGMSFGTVTGLAATLLHLFNHAAIKAALFMAVGAIVLKKGIASIESVRGLGRDMPLTMAAFVAGGLSLIGVPLTVGFISKWYLIVAAFEAGMWFIPILIVASSLLAVIYIWRVVEAAYFQEAPDGKRTTEAPLSLLVPTYVLIAVNLYFGIDTSLTVSVATQGAEILMGTWR